jgi:uncharacterized protein (DUF433 family)
MQIACTISIALPATLRSWEANPGLRSMRVTVGMIVGLVAAGHSRAEILDAYPYLEEEDIRRALADPAWRVREIEVLISAAR